MEQERRWKTDQPGYWRRVTGWEREEPRRRKTGTRRHLTCLPTRQSSLRARSSAGSTSGYFTATVRRALLRTAYERSFSSRVSVAYHPAPCFSPCFSFLFFQNSTLHRGSLRAKLLEEILRFEKIQIFHRWTG